MTEENEYSSFLQLSSVVHKGKTILTLKIYKLKILPPVTRVFQTASGEIFVLLFPACKEKAQPLTNNCMQNAGIA